MTKVKSEDELEQLLSTGQQMVHRLRDWDEGDTLYGVTFYNEGYDSGSGKTFKDEDSARGMFESGGLGAGPGSDTVLFKATVRNPTTEPHNPADPGEPPLKWAELEDVEILDRNPPETW